MIITFRLSINENDKNTNKCRPCKSQLQIHFNACVSICFISACLINDCNTQIRECFTLGNFVEVNILQLQYVIPYSLYVRPAPRCVLSVSENKKFHRKAPIMAWFCQVLHNITVRDECVGLMRIFQCGDPDKNSESAHPSRDMGDQYMIYNYMVTARKIIA